MSELELDKSDSKETKEADPHTQFLVSGLGSIIPPTSGDGVGDDPVEGQRVNATNSLLMYLTLDGGNALVNQVSRVVFDIPRDESLRAIVESFLISITWVEVFVRHNYTDRDINETVRVLTRRTVTSGSETNRELNIGLAYNGLSIGFGTSRRTFSSTETVSEREVTTSYTIPSRSSLYVYQRRYHFRDEVWWIANAWNDLWNVCRPGGGYDLLRVPNWSYIDADERMAINAPLTGTLRVSVSSPRPTYQSFRQINRQFQNHTTRTRNAVTRVINDSARHTRREQSLEGRDPVNVH